MNKCYIIIEENHGPIGVATSPKSAMRWLIDNDWLTAYSEYGIWDGKKWHHHLVVDYCQQNGIDSWEQWLMDNASVKFLANGFLIYLREADLAETE
jgi:hypothetical protein